MRLKTILKMLAVAVILGSVIWLQAAAGPAAAQSPEADLSVLVTPVGSGFSVADASSVPTFEVGDQFQISIVAQGVTEPGIFGSQFDIVYDPVHLQAIEGTLASGPVMEPVVVALSSFDLGAGVVSWAASRQGDLENLTGDIVLATLTLEAIAPTEPPEGQTTAITLDNVKLGAKGGIDVPVSGLVGAEVIIRDPSRGDMEGAVTAEGRAADNQAGHTVTAAGDLGSNFSTTTEPDGSFLLDALPTDTYSVTANSPGFLAALCEGVAHSGDALTELLAVMLLAGDIDDSGEIDITDAVAIGAAFGSTASGEVSDLNADGVVDILDLILMAANFGQTSAGNPWVCQL